MPWDRKRSAVWRLLPECGKTKSAKSDKCSKQYSKPETKTLRYHLLHAQFINVPKDRPTRKGNHDDDVDDPPPAPGANQPVQKFDEAYACVLETTRKLEEGRDTLLRELNCSIEREAAAENAIKHLTERVAALERRKTEEGKLKLRTNRRQFHRVRARRGAYPGLRRGDFICWCFSGGVLAENTTAALGYMIAYDNLPLSTTMDGFKTFVKASQPLYKPPTEPTVTKCLEAKYEELRAHYGRRIQAADHLNLTADIWMHESTLRSYGLTVHFI
ncbi:hypothetical protein HPB49_020909 [Dermacentor silvarum]|uniref:Uncharacterized protein n=1 Tax=Dermacentor silvarum TaxID=543639 RepID=A0ACB8DK82_DERSI|nr:hypothetical protein HPB49_020909 [Dermacentor silvarum]